MPMSEREKGTRMAKLAKRQTALMRKHDELTKQTYAMVSFRVSDEGVRRRRFIGGVCMPVLCTRAHSRIRKHARARKRARTHRSWQPPAARTQGLPAWQWSA